MNENLHELINTFSDLKVLVIGEAMLDTYLEGFSERLCREAPVPVVTITDRKYVPGGAANAAMNLRSLGAEVRFLSVIGNDSEGQVLREMLQANGVSCDSLISVASRRTLAKQRILAASQMVVRFDQGSTTAIYDDHEQDLIQLLTQNFHDCHAILISDYDYGILTPSVIRTLRSLQAAAPRFILVDSKRLLAYKDVQVTAFKPNYQEAQSTLKLPGLINPHERIDQMKMHGCRLLELTGAQIVAVTLDQDGSLVFTREDESPYRTYARPQPNSKAAGAGDTYISAFALGLAAGAAIENAAELASAASSIVVSKNGTAVCHSDELLGYFSTNEKFVTDVFHLSAVVAAYRRINRRIVFTNGCFDLLHRGHIAYLNRAKAFGDILIVGVNSDASVRRLKGPTRPINSLEDRVQILAALSCVDHIVPFNGDTPRELIRVIQPNVFVKGGDYTHAKLPEAPLVEELGGVVEILPYLENHSTSNLIERIRKIYANSSTEAR